MANYTTILRLWQESLDLRNEEAVSIYEFFDHVQEKKSDYGIWLFNSIDVSSHNCISFSQYVRKTQGFWFISFCM